MKIIIIKLTLLFLFISCSAPNVKYRTNESNFPQIISLEEEF
jgi:hypothetical protein